MNQQEEQQTCSLEYDELLEFYEKHYFHEIDMREKHLSRISVSFAMLVSLSTAIFYLISNIKNPSWSSQCFTLFLNFIVMSCITGSISINFFIKSFFNYDYEFLPTSEKTEEYRKLLIETYKPYENSEVLVKKYFKQYLQDSYIKSASVNTENNELRSIHFHNTMKFLIPAFTFAIFGVIFFYFGDIGKERPQELKVKISNPIEVIGRVTNDREPNIGKSANTSTTSTTSTVKTDKRRH